MVPAPSGGETRVGRPASSYGAGLFLFLLLSLGLFGCRGAGSGEPPGSEAELQTLGLPPGTAIHRITLGGRGADEHAVPTRIDAAPGDAVEFRTVDHRVHTLKFVLDSLAPEVRSFLVATGQDESPPLVSRGSRFILRLSDAPVGRYLFVTEGHGGSARGIVLVGAPAG
jgi:hypothetical protein